MQLFNQLIIYLNLYFPSITQATIKPGNWEWIAAHQGKPHEPERMQRAIAQSDELCRVLEMEGVTVRRPEIIDWSYLGQVGTPDFREGGK